MKISANSFAGGASEGIQAVFRLDAGIQWNWRKIEQPSTVVVDRHSWFETYIIQELLSEK
jgi:hypothetical protein